MKRLLTLSLFLLLVIEGIGQTKFTDKVGGHVFTMSIPEYMVKTYELNDAASLQYQNTNKEAYVIVVEDAKDQLEILGIKFTDAKNFLDDFIKDYKVENENRSVKNNSQFVANGNNCAQVEFYWTEEGTNFFMLITAVESKTHYYKILAWTIAENSPALKTDFQTMAKSIRD